MDTLIGGYFPGKMDAPVILTNQNSLGQNISDHLSKTTLKIDLLGGETVLSPYVYDMAKWVLHGKTLLAIMQPC